MSCVQYTGGLRPRLVFPVLRSWQSRIRIWLVNYVHLHYIYSLGRRRPRARLEEMVPEEPNRHGDSQSRNARARKQHCSTWHNLCLLAA